MQCLTQHFWKRWYREYLSELQVRSKWRVAKNSNFKPGVMVVIKEDNAAPIHWKMGRIIELHPRTDDIVRVATVFTAAGAVRRAITKLCPLPIEDTEEEN